MCVATGHLLAGLVDLREEERRKVRIHEARRLNSTRIDLVVSHLGALAV